MVLWQAAEAASASTKAASAAEASKSQDKVRILPNKWLFSAIGRGNELGKSTSELSSGGFPPLPESYLTVYIR